MTSSSTLILVVGMHRSGTSLAASLLESLGAALPGPWNPGDAHNETGYYEWLPIRDLQEQLLVELHRFWPSAAGVLPLPADWLEQPTTLRAAQRLEGLLRREARLQHGPWAIKDPRSSLLLPLWRLVAERLGLNLRLVEAVRDPEAVARSVLERDGRTVGMTLARAERLWRHHHERIHHDGQGLPRFGLAYESWFGPQARQQLIELARFCGLVEAGAEPGAEALQAAQSRIQPQQRHHVTGMAAGMAAAGVAAAPKPPEPLTLEALPEHLCLKVVGGSASQHWSAHAWLNRCPLPEAVRFGEEPEALRLTLHLQPLARSLAQGRLEALRAEAIVLDPSLNQVQPLRDAGVRAFWIDPQARSSGWLARYFNAHRCARRLGLPDPAVLARSGERLLLGSLGAAEDSQLPDSIWSLPRFDRLKIHDVDQARLLASWLNRCSQLGLQLVRLEASELERHGHAFSALDRPLGEAHLRWLPAPLLKPPVAVEAVEEELAWRRAGSPREEMPTPRPQSEVVWQWPPADQAPPAVEAAVCITLYNYADCITTALESVRRQSLRPLELVVVDDGSSDRGLERAAAWLAQHGPELGRVVLLRHDQNSGLAAARNTAFAACTAPWCQVLDADNTLEPQALRRCLAIAAACPADTALVHPLIGLRRQADAKAEEMAETSAEETAETCLEETAEARCDALMESIIWQTEALVDGNKVDAMALIRRASWQQVGGYVHSTAWTDYDLWCRFVEAGLHGVVCPQRLATYTQHDDSMNRSLRPRDLQRLMLLMQQRHHWLRLIPTHQS